MDTPSSDDNSNLSQRALGKIKSLSGPLVRVIWSMRHLALAQWEDGSRKYLQHRMKAAEVEAFKESIQAEVEVQKQLRAAILCKIPTADPLEMLRLRNDLRLVAEEERRYRIHLQALLHVVKDETLTNDQDTGAIPGEWLDRFQEFAKREVEPWREDLFARALAMKAKDPDSFDIDALWTIGTLSKRMFDDFALYLDISIIVGGSPLLPLYGGTMERYIALDAGSRHIGNVVLELEPSGLIHSPMGSTRFFEGPTTAKYGERVVPLSFKSRHNVHSVIPTKLGMSIAMLYEPRALPEGETIFNDWLEKTVPADAKAT